MSTKQICYHGWSFEARDRRILLPHVCEEKHHCGLPPGHAGPCVCRECGASPTAPETVPETRTGQNLPVGD